MAKDQYLSKQQKSIVNRYYANQDSRVTARLQELVSDLYLATGDAALKKKWDVVARELAKSNTDATAVKKLIDARDLRALAALIASPRFSAEKPTVAPAKETDDV